MTLLNQIAIDVLIVGVICNIYGCNVSIQINFGFEIENCFYCHNKKQKRQKISFVGKSIFKDK